MRLAAFIISLLLLAGTVDPTRGWLIALVVVTGLAATRLRPWAPWNLRPALDVRMGSFVLAILLLAGTVDANRDWLIAMTAVSGVAMVAPRLLALDRGGRDRWDWDWDWAWDRDSGGGPWGRRHDDDDWPRGRRRARARRRLARACSGDDWS